MPVVAKMAEREALFVDFEKVFSTETALRKTRPGAIDGELTWVVKEREAMMAAVNEHLAERGSPSVDLATFQKKVEWRALGHSDYARQMCVLSAFLVLGID